MNGLGLHIRGRKPLPLWPVPCGCHSGLGTIYLGLLSDSLSYQLNVIPPENDGSKPILVSCGVEHNNNGKEGLKATYYSKANVIMLKLIFYFMLSKGTLAHHAR